MDLNQLQELNALKYRHSQQALAGILEREATLRDELARLRRYFIETHSLSSEHAQLRAIGADVIWLRWVTRAQAQLNIELAQVLAQKEEYLLLHKRAFGKMQVSNSLADEDLRRSAEKQRQIHLERAVQQSLGPANK